MSDAIVAKIRDMGVVGAGGAGLPTQVKADARVETVLVNGASCEPLLMSDPYLMENEADDVLRGLHAMMECTGASKGIFCVKGKHGSAIESLRKAISGADCTTIEIFVLEDFYPAGDEQVLVHEVLGKTVPERGIPLQVGVVVSNVESLYNLARAVDGKPVTHRYITVSGEVARPMVVKAPVGSSVVDVLEFAGGATIDQFMVIDGGPMMGRVIGDVRQPVTKTTSGLIVLPPDHPVVAGKIMEPEKIRRITNTICCQCTRCTDMCPRKLLGHSLHPHKLMRVLESQVLESRQAREALLCSECGVCEKFACPMMLSPREVNAQIKRALMGEGVTWEGDGEALVPNLFRDVRRVPTSRLIQRLKLGEYEAHAKYGGEMATGQVALPLRQHIGAPARPVVAVGDRVSENQLIAEIPEMAMGARVHASIDGVVASIDNGIICIASCEAGR
ncbi:4Fe-4S dicluster domain-containing protein [Desulfosediminicola sp.]|uniref:4Fe-4S dicluster domain-containing protein n=1 Tax=Desulfosediminicola sp. TaxID=2886825 RepID=UPI003AF237A2